MFYQLPPPPPDYSYAYVEQVDICSIDIPYKKLINSIDILSCTRRNGKFGNNNFI